MSKTLLAQNPDWWRGAVIYQIYPRSFQDSSGSGTGDLRGITERLDHVASLGVDAIWLSPFFTSPMADMGYDVADYCDVDPSFGTLADFDALVARAHELGLRVMIDQVLSHSSDQHAWFKESRSSRDNPKADWYVWADPLPDGSPPNNWIAIFGGPAWEWDGVRRQYYLHNFLIGQPDLNFHNPEVRGALLDSVRFWLERGVDGFRLDVCNFYYHDASLASNPPRPADAEPSRHTNPYGMQLHIHDKTQPENLEFLKSFRALLEEYPDRASVGEIGAEERSLDVVAEYTGGGDKLHMSYTFDLLSSDGTPAQIASSIEKFETVVTDGWVCWALSNHDVNRHVSRWLRAGDDRETVARLAANLLLSLRGSVCIYQGEELGLEQAEVPYERLNDPQGKRFWPADKGRDGCRTPMPWEAGAAQAGFSTVEPWLPLDPRHAEQAVDRQGAPGTVLDHYRQMLAFRRAHPVLATGAIRIVEAGDAVLAFERSGEETLLMLFNLGRTAVCRDLPDGAVPLELPGNLPPAMQGHRVDVPAQSAACFRLA
ncbi:alpha-amylase family glycosyl hydrolase [Tropicimonas sp. TH_r6]|uniref:alpha-amylase family glycosyl hydrolase n=1 Tax=Tropicimonas sp. TH_r6 TaxID=3082085 RepID=UPI0029555D9B|nr:alpha-amylase family glycosyl hydrolase [Tropicimonas sp. TH_r6]MDV7143200.1 alpha-amylase family glycosyl hydrolase [Tropicimonas sp. TH_r6]